MKTVELAIAKKQLESLIGSELGQLDPDAIDACIPELRWESLPNDGLSDAKTATAIGLLGDTSISELTFVTDASFAAGVGAFLVEQSELSDFFTPSISTSSSAGGDGGAGGAGGAGGTGCLRAQTASSPSRAGPELVPGSDLTAGEPRRNQNQPIVTVTTVTPSISSPARPLILGKLLVKE